MFSNSINCLVKVSNKTDLINFKFNLSLYSLSVTILSILFVLLLEICLFLFKKVVTKSN